MDIKNSTTVQKKPSWIKALIYGQAGSGKTRFCADASKPFWFDWEDSTETLRHWGDYKEIPVKKPLSIEELKKDVNAAINDPEIDTIVLDSITSGLDYYLRQFMAKQNRDRFQIYESDYKYATNVFGELFTILRDVDLHVLIIGHARVIRDVDTGNATGIYPDITPRLQQNLIRLVNLVGYMEVIPSGVKERTRRLYVNSTKVIEAKNRLNLQMTYIENPTFKELFND